jgi:diadenosine tetraphosphatase ApaH/serine/threonine PP2A family protein phosphatase
LITALLADIHSNIEALQACLAHARAAGAERHVFLGDLVGYGASPQAVIDVVREHMEAGALAVKGNHDEAVVSPRGEMHDEAARAIAWTREALGEDARNFLGGLPLILRAGNCCFVHASADAPQGWEYIDHAAAARKSIAAAQTVYTFSGHVHEQLLYFETAVSKVGTFRPVPGSAVPVGGHRRWLAIAGSVGQPRDRNPAAAYALFDDVRAEIVFHRVPYDHHAAARRIREAGMGEGLAWRIEQGV